MNKLKIFLKSGQTIDVECDKFEFKHNNFYEFTGYKLTGIKNFKCLFLLPSEIVEYMVYND